MSALLDRKNVVTAPFCLSFISPPPPPSPAHTQKLQAVSEIAPAVRYTPTHLPDMINDERCRWNEKIIHPIKLFADWLGVDGMMGCTPTGLINYL